MSPYIPSLFFPFLPGINAAVDAAYTSNYSPVMYTSTLTALDNPVNQLEIQALEDKTKALNKETQKLTKKARIKRCWVSISIVTFDFHSQISTVTTNKNTNTNLFCYILTS